MDLELGARTVTKIALRVLAQMVAEGAMGHVTEGEVPESLQEAAWVERVL